EPSADPWPAAGTRLPGQRRALSKARQSPRQSPIEPYSTPWPEANRFRTTTVGPDFFDGANSPKRNAWPSVCEGHACLLFSGSCSLPATVSFRLVTPASSSARRPFLGRSGSRTPACSEAEVRLGFARRGGSGQVVRAFACPDCAR